jgi:heterodisulfide reductase subunit D
VSQYEPKIVGFLCNWCGYAGADLAGTSRLSYPTNIRIIRLMCSGRVEPAFILKAFENRADGVLVAGCHPGDCHYRAGNNYAEKRVEKTKKLLDLVGIGSDRLRLEWISAAEGEKFASVIKDFTEKLRIMGPSPIVQRLETAPVLHNSTESIHDILKRTKALYCQECGKCSSSCPITRLDPAYSPRLAVEKALMGLEDSVLTDKGLWSCLTCYLCRQRCPLDIEYDELIRTCRAKASDNGIVGNCSHEGVLYSLSRLMANPNSTQNRLGWVPQGAEFAKTGEILYWTGCLPYFDVVFDDIGVSNVEIAQSMLKIMNASGLKPVLLENERCCGHDLGFAGDLEGFERLAKMNIAAIRKSRASTVVTSCPECYRTLKADYADLVGKLKFEVLHASEFIANLIDSSKIRFEGKLARKVSYQDPCRLGRHMGVYDAPRKVLTSIPGVEFIEMERNRQNAICCGVSAWMGCGRHSKQMQIERLTEAKATQADLLVTACPKCQIHFNCALSEKLPVKKEDVAIETCDLSVLVARALNLTEKPEIVQTVETAKNE